MYIRVKDKKIVEVIMGTDIDEKGLIEVSDEYKDMLRMGYPLLYDNGEITIDKEVMDARNEEDAIRIEMDNLRSQLSATDYVVIKIAEGVAAEKDYADILKDRAEWRKRINEIEEALNNG